MKRLDLIKHLRRRGCILFREGSNHSVFINRVLGKASTVLRHNEINNFFENVKKKGLTDQVQKLRTKFGVDIIKSASEIVENN